MFSQWIDARLAKRARAVLALVAMSAALASGDALACGTLEKTDFKYFTVVYSSGNAGDVLGPWHEAPSTLYSRCWASVPIPISIEGFGAYLGEMSGYPTFASPDKRIGMQIQYKYNNADGGGWTGWQNVTQNLTYINIQPEGGMRDALVRMDFRVRLVALERISENITLFSALTGIIKAHIFGDYRDDTYAPRWQEIHVETPRAASCRFRTLPAGNKVDIEPVSVMFLRNPGDVSRSTPFSWSYTCDPGNEGHSGMAGITYGAVTTVTDGANGRMAVTGGAKGVDLQVLRKTGSTVTPIVFGNRYRTPPTATEDLEVRYYRTTDPLVPGAANGGLTIELLPW
ncbi:fimbrial protein [[Pseudomonas] boreopolis]|uniref:fimbrial protein n=1 Tax=Xanthomonas boreopolis TaxID=86183 RepID=UPI003DA0CF1F